MPSTPESTASRPAPSRYERRWRLPPPYLRGQEGLEGSLVLEELGGPLGLVLWQAMRDAALWALTPADRREGLFTGEAESRRLADLLALGEPPAALEEPLRALAALLSHPADIGPEAVMLACQRISQWAEEREARATALAFAQAAALATPASAREALRVGRLASQRGEYARAEGWLQRAVVLARQERDSVTHAWTYTALGHLYFQRGNFPASERHHLRALRISRRHSLLRREAAALHDLLTVCGATGRYAEALHFAGQAVAAYGPNHDRLPSLAHDVALLLAEQGRFAAALPILTAVWPRLEPRQRLLGAANAARAAGALGDRDVFSRYAEIARELLGHEANEDTPSALLNLARGAAGLQMWDDAFDLGRESLRLASRLHQGKIQIAAESLLHSIDAERHLSSPGPSPVQPDDELASRVSRELVACLTG